MISFIFMLLLTSLTGSVLFIIWYGIVRIVEKSGYINIVFYILEGILLFWFLPISYWWLIVKSRCKWGYILFSSIKGIDFYGKIVFYFWIIGASLSVCNLILKVFAMCVQKKQFISVDGEVYDQFCRICRELEIENSRIELFYDYKAVSPYISGICKNYIVLPCREYTSKQLEVILFHELTHYKQKSMLLRYVMEICVCIHFFNPIIWIYRNRLHYWEEYVCDYEVIQKLDNLEDYYHVVDQIANQSFTDRIWGMGIVGKDIQNRKNMVKRSYRMKKSSKILFVAIVFTIVTSTSMVAGATEIVGNGYFNTYLAMADRYSSVEEEIEDVEYVADGIEEGITVNKDLGSMVSMLGSMINVDWSINGYEAYESVDFMATKGQDIVVSALIEPTDAVVRVGIKQPGGTIRYVLINGTGGTYHRFAISQSGTYCMYVQNMSSNAIDVNLSYRVE